MGAKQSVPSPKIWRAKLAEIDCFPAPLTGESLAHVLSAPTREITTIFDKLLNPPRFFPLQPFFLHQPTASPIHLNLTSIQYISKTSSDPRADSLTMARTKQTARKYTLPRLLRLEVICTLRPCRS